jgi:hypothetical protein
MTREEKQVLINRLDMEGLYIRFKAAALKTDTVNAPVF